MKIYWSNEKERNNCFQKFPFPKFLTPEILYWLEKKKPYYILLVLVWHLDMSRKPNLNNIFTLLPLLSQKNERVVDDNKFL